MKFGGKVKHATQWKLFDLYWILNYGLDPEFSFTLTNVARQGVGHSEGVIWDS